MLVLASNLSCLEVSLEDYTMPVILFQAGSHVHKIISGYPDLTPTKNKNKTDLFTEAYRNHWVPLIESDKFHNIHYMWCVCMIKWILALFICSVFEAERPGCRFSVKQRIATYFYKVSKHFPTPMSAFDLSQSLVFIMTVVLVFYVRQIRSGLWLLIQGVLYGSVGFGCGLVGQGIANLIMTAKRLASPSHWYMISL